MTIGKIISPNMDDYEIYLNWFSHRDNVEFETITKEDGYEILFESEDDDFEDELSEFMEIFEGPPEKEINFKP